MKKAIGHLRSNAIAYLALFVALGGTGYAAVSIPRNSVGTRQLRNGAVTIKKLANRSITAAKLNTHSIAGSVVFWAKINQNGQILRSSEPATTGGWSTGIGQITFHARLSSSCFALGTAGQLGEGEGTVSPTAGPLLSGQEKVLVYMAPLGDIQSAPLPVQIAVICPN